MVTANRALTDMVGGAPLDLRGQALVDVAGQPLCDAVRLDLSGRTHQERRVRRADGSVIWVSVISTRLPDTAGERARVLLQLRNIDAEKTAMREVQRHRELLAAAQRVSKIGHWYMELGSERSEVSDEFLRIFGFDPSTARPISKQNFDARVHPAERDAVMNEMSEKISRLEPWNLEHRITLPHAPEKHVQVVGEVMLDEDGKPRGVFTTVQDITSRKQVELAWTRSAGSQATLLRETHHRIKNNLQIISSLLALQRADIQNPRARVLLDESVSRIHSVALIHRQLYGFDTYTQIELCAYAQALIETLRDTYGRGSRCEIRASPPVEVAIEVAVPLGLVLHEMITNASKHAAPSGASQAPWDVLVELQADRDTVTLAVSDKGPGLPPDFDISTATTLGLRLITQLTRQLRGSLSVTSQPGARFELTCPRRPTQATRHRPDPGVRRT